METPRPPCARAGVPGPRSPALAAIPRALPEITNFLGPGIEAEVNCEEIARLAADLLGAPMALITLRDKASGGGGMVLKARVGLGPEDAAHALPFHAAASAGALLVPDASADGRFAACALVSGPQRVRFCAAAPLIGRGGAAFGALAVFDTEPRAALRGGQADHLRLLARTAVQHLDFVRLHAVAVASSQLSASTADAIVCADARGAITFWNRAAEALFGYARDEAVGQPLDLIVPERLRAAHDAGFARATAAPRPPGKPIEFSARHRSGREIEIEVSFAAWEQGGEPAVGAIIRDVTERKRAEAELRRTRAFADTVVESMPAALFVKTAADLRYVRLNRGGEELWNVAQDAILGKTAPEIFGTDVGEGLERNDRAVLRSGKLHVYEGVVRRPGGGGDRRMVRTTKVAIPGPSGSPAYLLGFVEDITERREAEARIAHMAGHDALTGLPNRTLLRERLEQAVRGGAAAAVLCLDLDRFKEVNDTLGHPVGDALLRAVTERLRGCAQGRDVVARLGGDEFAVVLPAPAGTPEGAAGFASRVVEALAEPFPIEGHQLLAGASIGIAVSPADGADADTLLRRADMALHRAKAEGRATWRFFEPALDAQLQGRRLLEADLRRAVREEGFELHYQPLFRTPTGRVSGVEALLRWRRPDGGGLVPPGDFIPLAEETGLIPAIGDWVLRTACAEVARWPSDTLSVAVNLSPAQFRRGGLVGGVRAALAASGLPPARLELEITESVLLENDRETLGTLRELRALGVRIAMDDFGTGYSSLGYLQRFPFDKIKIDRMFVREMAENANCMAIVRAVVSLGATLGVTITAEGVETPEQLALLRDIGCEEAQGFLLGRPQTAAEVVERHLPGRTGAPMPAEAAAAPA